jgi:predicted Zn-dependent protease
MAHASLGMLRVRQGKVEDALKSLERAVAASSQNYLIHYYYAYVLSRVGNRDMQTLMGFPPQAAAKMRSELKQAIELRPDFPESYSLLAFVNLVTETDLTQTLEMLKRALAASPGRDDLIFMMAQIYMRKEDFTTARQLINNLSSSSDEEIRRRAQSLLTQLVSVEGHLARMRTTREEQATDSRNPPELRRTSDEQEQDAVITKFDPAAALRESLRKPAAGETQSQGTLARIDCDPKGITFVVRIGERLLKLRTESFHQVDLTTYSDDARGQVTCGLRKPENNVIISYLPASEARPKVDGVVKSVEFVPPDFTLKATP